MAKLEITGTVHNVSPTVSFTSRNGNTIYKREIILDTTRFDPYTGERSEYENYPKFEFRGDKCAKLDNVNMGDVVKIFFDINGRFYINKDNQQSHINNVEGYDVEIVRIAATPQSNQVQQPAPQAPQQAFAPAYPQNPQGFNPQNPYGNTMMGGGNTMFP